MGNPERMIPARSGARFLALCLSLALALPTPVLALKPTETKEGAGLEELDKALRAFVSDEVRQIKALADRMRDQVKGQPFTEIVLAARRAGRFRGGLEEKELLDRENLLAIQPTFPQVVKQIQEDRDAWIRLRGGDVLKILEEFEDPSRWKFYSQAQKEYAAALSQMNLAELRQEALQRGGKFEFSSFEEILNGIVHEKSAGNPSYSLFAHYLRDPFLAFSFARWRYSQGLDSFRDYQPRFEKMLREIAFWRELFYRWDASTKPRSHVTFQSSLIEREFQIPAARVEEMKDAARQLHSDRQVQERMDRDGGTVVTPRLEAAGLKVLLEYVAQEDVIRTIAVLAESGKTGPVTEDFPALEGLAKEAGFVEGVVAILRTVAAGEAVLGVPAEYAAQGIPVFVKKEWEDQVRQNLSSLETAGGVRFVRSAADAYLVIGDNSVSVRPDQAFIAINEETVSRVTPHLLQELQISGLLKAGS